MSSNNNPIIPIKKPATFNEWADYWRNIIGVNVIPAQTKIKKTYEKWAEWQSNPIPQEVHDQWKRDDAFRHGMAIIPGKVWHNTLKKDLYFIFVDLDNFKAVEEFCTRENATISLKQLATSCIVEQHKDDTNRAHVYFYARKPFKKKGSDRGNVKFATKLDTNEIPALEVKGLGEHGIAYCSPSIHSGGYPYEILGTMEPLVIDEFEKHIDNLLGKFGIPYLDGSDATATDSNFNTTDLWNPNATVFAGHNRHEAFLRICDSLLKRFMDMPEEVLKKLAEEKNRIMCNPPLPQEDVDAIWNQAKNYIRKHTDIEEVKKTATLVLERDEEESDKDRIVRIAEILLASDYHFKTLKDTDEVLFYENGVYKKGGEVVIRDEARKMWPDSSIHQRNEIIDLIRTSTHIDRDEFDREAYIINIHNGIVDLRTGEFREHTPEYLSTIQLPVEYNPKTRCPNITRYLFNCFYVSDIITVLEFLAYCMMKHTKLQKDLMLTGEGNQGKSVMLDLMAKFLGEGNVSHVSLHELVEDRYATADLYGKLANIFADISSKKLADVAMFKMLATGDKIRAQFKYKQPFTYRPTAKLIFSANTPPKPSDDMDDAYYRRWILISVNLRKVDFFTKQVLVRDPDLVEKLTAKEEMSGLLNILIAVSKKLIQRRKFFHQQTIAEIREEYQKRSDPVKAWIQERCVIGKDYIVEKEAAFQDYFEFCSKKRFNRLEDKVALGRELARNGIFDTRVVREGERGSDDDSEREHVWYGMTLRSQLRKAGQSALDEQEEGDEQR